MSKRRQTLEFTDGDIGVLRRSNPEEELSHGAWVVGGHQDEIVASWQLGLQGDRPRVGEVQASHQAQLRGLGQRPEEPPVHLEVQCDTAFCLSLLSIGQNKYYQDGQQTNMEETDSNREPGILPTTLVTQLAPPLLHQGNAHLNKRDLPGFRQGLVVVHLVGARLEQTEGKLWVVQQDVDPSTCSARAPAP